MGDIRFAFRIFKRSPAVALTVIGTLAVALGLNATAYSFFNAYVIKPAAVHDPGTLYRCYTVCELPWPSNPVALFTASTRGRSIC